jgi:hypothetical protein
MPAQVVKAPEFAAQSPNHQQRVVTGPEGDVVPWLREFRL